MEVTQCDTSRATEKRGRTTGFARRGLGRHMSMVTACLIYRRSCVSTTRHSTCTLWTMRTLPTGNCSRGVSTSRIPFPTLGCRLLGQIRLGRQEFLRTLSRAIWTSLCLTVTEIGTTGTHVLQRMRHTAGGHTATGTIIMSRSPWRSQAWALSLCV